MWKNNRPGRDDNPYNKETEAGCGAVVAPVEPSVGRLDRERADFEAWAAKQWGKEAWRHMSGTSGEWEAYRAGVMAAEAQWERALRLAWNMVDPLQPAGRPGSYARGQDNGIVAALKTVRDNLMACHKAPNVGIEPPRSGRLE